MRSFNLTRSACADANPCSCAWFSFRAFHFFRMARSSAMHLAHSVWPPSLSRKVRPQASLLETACTPVRGLLIRHSISIKAASEGYSLKWKKVLQPFFLNIANPSPTYFRRVQYCHSDPDNQGLNGIFFGSLANGFCLI